MDGLNSGDLTRREQFRISAEGATIQKIGHQSATTHHLLRRQANCLNRKLSTAHVE
jgi:hypothetical protein